MVRISILITSTDVISAHGPDVKVGSSRALRPAYISDTRNIQSKVYHRKGRENSGEMDAKNENILYPRRYWGKNADETKHTHTTAKRNHHQPATNSFMEATHHAIVVLR